MDNSVNSTRVSEGGGAEGGQHHSSSGHYGSAAHSEGVMHTMKRVYTFNELVARHLSAKASDSKSSNNSNNTNIIKTYIASLTDRNPSTELLKMLRVKTREKAMLFTDVLAPQHLYVCLLPSSDRGSVFDSNFVVESHRKFRYFHPLSVPTHTNKWRLLVKDEIPTREEALALHRSLLISGKGAVLPADSNNFCPLVLNNTTQQQQHQQQQQQEFEEHSKKKNSNSSKRVESARKRPRSEERKVSPQQSSTSNNDTTNKKEKMKSNKRAREEAAPSKKSAKKAKTEKSKK